MKKNWAVEPENEDSLVADKILRACDQSLAVQWTNVSRLSSLSKCQLRLLKHRLCTIHQRFRHHSPWSVLVGTPLL